MEPMWSPHPVVGYRVWAVMRDRVKGFRSVWSQPRFNAACENEAAYGPVPHVGERCGCGIYAAKDPMLLTREFPGIVKRRPLENKRPQLPTPAVAVGRVELSGRVVEHTHGYRAQIAEVTTLVTGSRRGVFRFDDPDEIADLFAHPHRTLDVRRVSEGHSVLGVLRHESSA